MNEIKYNTTDKTWHDVAHKENVWIKWRFEVLLRSMKKAGINLNNNLKCLDVGCGSNSFALNFESVSNFDKGFIKCLFSPSFFLREKNAANCFYVLSVCLSVLLQHRLIWFFQKTFHKLK